MDNTSSYNSNTDNIDAFLNSNLFLQMHPRKKNVITKLITQAKGKSAKEALPLLIRANAELKKMNLSFSSDESAQIFLILTANMPEEKREQLRQFLK